VTSTSNRPDAEASPVAQERLRLGVSLARKDDLERADRQLAAAVALDPSDARLHYNFALVAARQGRGRVAESFYRSALSLDRRHRSSLNNLGQLLMAQKRQSEAETQFRASLACDPVQPHCHSAIGIICLGLNRVVEARHHLAAALALAPDYGLALHNMGLLSDRDGRADAAKHWFALATATKDPPAEAYFSLGVAAQKAGHADRAVGLYREALARMPDNTDARANLANALIEVGDIDEALAEIGRALDGRPDHPDLLWSLSWIKLLRGDLDAGFATYGVRWARAHESNRQKQFNAPLWDGRRVEHGRLLLWGESGVGDEVLCAGMIGDALAAGNQVVIETDRRFVPLFQRSYPGAEVVLRKTPPEPPAVASDIVAQSSTLRLPMLLRRRWQDFPKHQGYLKPDPVRVADYRQRFARLGPGRKIGLAWASTNARTGGRKSTRLEDWMPVLSVPGVQFVSLQYGADNRQIELLRTRGVSNLWANPSPDIRADLEALAAQIAALDAVVTIAGINAHMCGALGKPGLVLVQHTPLWFWFDRGETSPWYPSLTLIRQDKSLDWQAPIARIAAALATDRPAG